MGMFDVFGDIVNAYSSHREASMQRDFNKDEAEKSRQWQEEMSNTQYQRMVQDLNAAGLSPMLAYSKGTPSLPSGSTASSSATGQGLRLGETESRSSQSALAREQAKVAEEQAQVARSQVVVNNAQAAKLAAESANIHQDTENKKLYPGMNDAQIKELLARIPQHGASAEQLRALMDVLKQEKALKEPEQKFKEDHPTYSKYASPVMDVLRTIFGGVGLLRGTSALPNVTKVERAKR